MKIKKWEDYVQERESGDFQVRNEVSETDAIVNNNEKSLGEPFDKDYRDTKEYEKMLEFLRGKKNVPSPVKPTKETPKGWFVVDEVTRGFWVAGAWSQDQSLISDAVISTEEAARKTADAVGGLVIPASEVLS